MLIDELISGGLEVSSVDPPSLGGRTGARSEVSSN